MTAALTYPETWDGRVDALSDAAGSRAYEAAEAALERGATPEQILDVTSQAIDDFTSSHPGPEAYGGRELQEVGRRHRFEDLYRALRAGEIPTSSFVPLVCLVEYAQASGDNMPCGWRPALYLNMVEWLIAPEPSIPALLKLVDLTAEYFVRWQASDDHDTTRTQSRAHRKQVTAADPFIARLEALGADKGVHNDERCACGASLAHVAGDGASATLCPECDRDGLEELTDVGPVVGQTSVTSFEMTPSRPTPRQLAFAADELSMEGSNRDEQGLALYAVGSWLRTLVPSEVVAELDAEIGDGRTWEDVDGPRAEPDAVANGDTVEPEVMHSKCINAVEPHAQPATPDALDWSGNASKAAGIAAKAAARDAFAAGADPLIVVDAALPAIAHFREIAGQSARHVAADPLAALVSELRHKRVPSQFARAVRGLGVAADANCEALYSYDDGHERREGDNSVSELIDLIDIAAFEGSRDELVEKVIGWAQHFAGRLVGWQEAILHDSDLADPATRALIEGAADAFIAGLAAAHASFPQE